jgi:GT2 family glycosyltransferase
VKPILAIIVLYKMRIAASPTCQTLAEALMTDGSLADTLDLLLVDNSPDPQDIPAGMFPDSVKLTYLHDCTNPGLASRYNYALKEASRRGATWLMLLDHDTTLTPQYCEQVKTLSASLAANQKIVALVPKLVSNRQMRSPHKPRYRHAGYHFDIRSTGMVDGLIRAFNSGAVVRVSAVEAIGGFPEEYWLDYLDHATLHRLQARGGRLWVMDAFLDHDMSVHRPGKHQDPANAARHTNQLAAERRFYHEHGDLSERIIHRLHLLVSVYRSVKKNRFAQAGRLIRSCFTIAERYS